MIFEINNYCFSVLLTPQVKLPLAMNPGVIGLSSEWSGTLTPEAGLHQDKTFVRSKVRNYIGHNKDILHSIFF